MACNCCGIDHDPMGSCALFLAPYYAVAFDYPRFFLTEGGVAIAYVVPCGSYEEGEAVRKFLRATEGLVGSATSNQLPQTQEHDALSVSGARCFYVFRWHPEVLLETIAWRR